MSTRRTIEAIAAGMREAKPPTHAAPVDAIAQHMRDCLQLADALSRNHARFDRARFLADCGVAS
jgi:hypothetical protein